MPGTMIAHYEVIDRIGGGGFATVYRARDVQSGETVALKVLHPQYARDQEFIERFHKEGELIRNLPDNPHLVKPKEQGIQGDTCYLAMEYVEGQDLDELLTRHGCLSFEEAVDIAAQVAEAMDCAHQWGVIHRDIKPQNIKITPAGVVKVLDFGIARATEGTRLTQTGVFIGTPQYMAPEVWEGKPADCRTDVYALGLVLYEMIAGHPPFQADAPAAAMRQHLLEKPQILTQVRHDTPPHLAWLVDRSLAKQPEQRWQSAGEMLAALRGQITVKPPIPPEPRPRAPSRPLPRPGPGLFDKAQLEAALDRVKRAVTGMLAALRARPQAYLVGQAGVGAGYRYNLPGEGIIIGREVGSHIILNDRYLSSRHARILQQVGRYIIQDLNSYNGTYVNGHRVRQGVMLRNGDQIQMGSSVFIFHEPQPGVAVPGTHGGMVVREQDRLLAAFAHMGVILLPGIFPLVVMLQQKRPSPYVDFQVKQALFYQFCFVALLLLRQITFLSFFPLPLLWLVVSAYGGYAAYRCYQGLNFRYPILSDLAARQWGKRR